MRISGAYPSKYVKAADLPDGSMVSVAIDHVLVENVAGDSNADNEKPVLYFQNKRKGLVLNKTNAKVISSAYGDETEQWEGKRILLYSTETTFQGKVMPCIRVKIDRNPGGRDPDNGAVAAVARPAVRQPVRQPAGGPFDDISDDPNSLPPEEVPFD